MISSRQGHLVRFWQIDAEHSVKFQLGSFRLMIIGHLDENTFVEYFSKLSLIFSLVIQSFLGLCILQVVSGEYLVQLGL